MSKSMNMLRTRRRDNNVKPNRKLDRKSSRGMIYENEELRLKTININAEVERGQSDIKKLKRENEMLKKEIWCLRDEYEKLDKLLKEKEINFSSSSTTCTTSETESCSSCSSDSDQVETNQNLENVQKTNLKNLHVEFDHLSVVPEENSTENSDKNSNRTSIPNDGFANEKNIIKPDQSYPSFETLSKANTLQMEEKMPKHFFSPIKSSKSCDGSLNNEFIPQAVPNLYESHSQYYLSRLGEYPRQTYPQQGVCSGRGQPVYENLKPHTLGTMQPISKSSTDLIVKMDNQNFNTMTSSSFSNGGNLEELLNDIESISQDILKLSNPNLTYNGENHQFPHGYDTDIPPNPPPNYENIPENREVLTQPVKPYKSELNVVLMPTPMPLIGFEKYRTIKSSLESLKSKSLDNLTEAQNPHQMEPQGDLFYSQDTPQNVQQTPLNFIPPTPIINQNIENPFYFGPPNTDYFNRYNPDNYINNGLDKNKNKPEVCSSKTNLIDSGVSNEQISSENEENLKFKTSKVDKEDGKSKDKGKTEKKAEKPKLNITRKVSIHFKGKKDKKREETMTPKTPSDKKHPIFDIKFTSDSKKDGALQKTPSLDSKKSNVEDPKTGSSSDSKTDKRNSNSNEPRTPCAECKNPERKCSFDGKIDMKKTRKSQSVSPERKHVHVKDEAKKKHKNHKKADKLRNRRSTISNERHAERIMRERSFSVCTDRSNMLGLGYSGYSMYDEFMSDRERTNSMSSCGTVKIRKMSNISSFPVTGKIPWCGCWGNGCL